jgi:hypothetical protein
MIEASIGLIIVTTVLLLVITLVACSCLCCICCAIPVFKIFARILGFSPSTQQSHQLSASGAGARSGEYELVASSQNQSVPQSGYYVQPSAPQLEEYDGYGGGPQDTVIAQAYLVPPLAEVHPVSADGVVGDQERVQILQEQAAQHSDGGFRDWWAALLFLLNIAVIVYLTVQSVYALKANHSEDSTSTASFPTAKDTVSSYVPLLETVLAFTAILTVTAAMIGTWILSMLMNHAENLIELIMWGNIVIQAVSGILCLVCFQLIGAVIFGVLAALNYWYLWSVRAQIPFSSTVLVTACTAVKANYAGLFSTAFCALFIQLGWLLLWAVAFIGVLHAYQERHQQQQQEADAASGLSHARSLGSHRDDDDDGYNDDYMTGGSDVDSATPPLYVFFLLFLSLYWGIQVIKSVVQTTIAGTLACWWFQPTRESPVRGSLFRSLTTSFGSVCLGSLLVALVQAVRQVVEMLRQQVRRRSENSDRRGGGGSALFASCCLCLLDGLLDWVDKAMQYFNKYAFCYVAAYGLGFVQAGKLVTTLFYSRYVWVLVCLLVL